MLQSGRSSISQLGSLGTKPLDIHINLQNTWITSFLVKQKDYFLFLPLHSTHSKASIVLQTEIHTLVTFQNVCSTGLCRKEQSYQLYPVFTPQKTGSGSAPQYMGCDFPDQIRSWSYVEQPVCTRKCRQLLKGYISFLHTSTSKPYCSTAWDSNTSYKNRQHNPEIELQPSFNWLPALSHFLKLQIANTNAVISKCVLLSAGDKL